MTLGGHCGSASDEGSVMTTSQPLPSRLFVFVMVLPQEAPEVGDQAG